jgi:ubiquinone/menaquinone biosynthesis C-methylase UbiE
MNISNPELRDAFISRINESYDERMYASGVRQYYGDTDFFNFGFWRPDTRTQKEACENLMEELLRRIPDKRGNILDVACGKGATTAYLRKYYKPSQVTGINISRTQLQDCARNAPGCTFHLMDATALSFPDNSFQNAICVEAAFHFNTREKFFAEVLRVLKHGGRFAFSDILLYPWAQTARRLSAPQLTIVNTRQYRDVLLRCGFQVAEISDTTFSCHKPFLRNLWRAWEEEVINGTMTPSHCRQLKRRNFRAHVGVLAYVLGFAVKSNR